MSTARPNHSTAPLRIGALANATGHTVETIRYYERSGLLSASLRGSNNYRYYRQQHVDELYFIKRCRALDMTLAEIRALLALRANKGSQCADVEGIISAHLGHVEKRLAELNALKRQLVALQTSCGHESQGERCAIIARLESPAEPAGPGADKTSEKMRTGLATTSCASDHVAATHALN